MEYLIKRTDGDWFDLHIDHQADAFLRPGSSDRIIPESGDFSFSRDGIEIQINGEIAGLHIIIEPEIDEGLANQWMFELLSGVERVTGQQGEIIPL